MLRYGKQGVRLTTALVNFGSLKKNNQCVCQRCVSQHGVRLSGVRTENRKTTPAEYNYSVMKFSASEFFHKFFRKNFYFVLS